MSLEDLLLRGRARAEELMVDACTVSRGGEPVFNSTTGQYESVGVTVYPTPEQVAAGNPGKCRIQSGTTQASNPEAGGAVFTVERVELQVPFGTDLEIDDVAVITESVNPGLVTNRYRVTGLGEKTHATSSRYTVEVVT